MFSNVVMMATKCQISCKDYSKVKHLTEFPLTVLALVSLVLIWAATGRLVAHVDRAVASVQAVILTSVAVTVGPCEALRTSAGWST